MLKERMEAKRSTIIPVGSKECYTNSQSYKSSSASQVIHEEESLMSKGEDSKKAEKKAPAKTPKEKKADKKIKKADKKK
jgi:hypothetical protein